MGIRPPPFPLAGGIENRRIRSGPAGRDFPRKRNVRRIGCNSPCVNSGRLLGDEYSDVFRIDANHRFHPLDDASRIIPPRKSGEDGTADAHSTSNGQSGGVPLFLRSGHIDPLKVSCIIPYEFDGVNKGGGFCPAIPKRKNPSIQEQPPHCPAFDSLPCTGGRPGRRMPRRPAPRGTERLIGKGKQ